MSNFKAPKRTVLIGSHLFKDRQGTQKVVHFFACPEGKFYR